MNYTEGYFKGVRDSKLFYQTWQPEGEIKAGIVIVHGLGEHSGRYGNVVDHLLPLGYACYGFDNLGHGKSEGDREFVQSFEDFTISLAKYIKKVKEWLPNKPIFLLGHSMGGLIATYYLLDHSNTFHGAIISAPLITVPEKFSQGTIMTVKLLSKLAPKLRMIQLEAKDISRDPEVVNQYLNDPLVFNGKTPIRSMAEMLEAMIRLENEMKEIELPFIVLQASEDKLVDPISAKTLYEQAKSSDKTLRIYDGLYHEIFNEPERELVLQDVADWLDDHL